MTLGDLDKIHIHFDPPREKKPRRGRRVVSLITETGAILAGIIVHYRKGHTEEIQIPDELSIENFPEYANPKLPLSQLDRDALRLLVRDKLRYRPEPSQPQEWNTPGESGRLLKKAAAARRCRTN